MPIQNPLSIPGGWKKDQDKDTPAGEEPNPVESQTIPRTPSGVVSESGGILDDAGNNIGKVISETSEDGKSLVGGTVTGAGDILDKETGEVLGRASLDSHDSGKEGEYTTGGDDSKSQQPEQSQRDDQSQQNDDDRDDQSQAPSQAQSKQQQQDDEQQEDQQDGQSQKSGSVSGTIKSGLNAAASLTGGRSGKSDAGTERAQSEVPDVDESADKVQDTAKDAASEAPADSSVGQDTPDANDAQSEVPSQAGEINLDDREKDDDNKDDQNDESADKSGKDDDADDNRTEVPESTVGGGKSQSNLDLSEKGDEAQDDVGDKASQVQQAADDKAAETGENLDDKTAETQEGVDETKADAEDKLDETKSQAPDTDEVKADAEDKVDDTKSQVPDTEEAKPDEAAADAQDNAEAKVDDAQDKAEDAQDKAEDKADEATDAAADAQDKAEDKADEAAETAEDEAPKLDFSILDNGKVNKAGNIVDDNGEVVGRVVEGDPKKIQGRRSDEEGNIWSDSGKIVGKAEPLSEAEREEKKKNFAPFENFPDAIVEADGRVTSEGRQVGSVVEGDPKKLKGSKVDEDGDILDRNGNTVGRAEAWDEPEPIPEEPEAKVDRSILKNGKVNKAGNIVDDNGEVVGRLVEGDAKKLQGRRSDEEGNIWSDSGKVVGRAEPLSDEEREEKKKNFAPFENFPDAVVEADGRITSEGRQVGTVVEGDPKKLKGSKVDEDGDILDRNGNTVGRAEAWDEPEPEAEEPEPEVDRSILSGKRVNKAGNVVDDNGKIFGRVSEGHLKSLVGRVVDKEGNIWSDSGKVIGKAEPLSDDDRDDSKGFAPFENFPDAVVEADGRVTSEGRQVGTVVEGDPKRLKGSKVDEDGDILDRNGNAVGRAEPWDEPEPEAEEPEPEVDRSILAGKRVNKAGNVVDSAGTIFGRVVEGAVSSMVGRMSDKEGNIRSESGDILGKAEVVPEGEREGSKEGPFAELSGLTVRKDGMVVTPSDEVVGRLVSGDPKKLSGRSVDEDGDVIDKNGNSLGKAERYEEPEEEVQEKKHGPLHGRKVNKEGNVVDEDGNVIAKLVSGDLLTCSGKEIDDDGDVINSKGNTVGHVALLEDIPEPEPEEEPEPEPEVETESEEQRKEREQAEADRKLAGQLSGCVEQSLEKIKPICKLISDKIDKAERTPKEELDEEQLVREVKPLIEEGGKILSETNGIIRGLDPDGRIQRQAKQKSGTREASPEEYHLAEVLKELTGNVTQTVDNAKRKIDGMPKAKKELNPLWGLLMEPLGQILAAVGLLLTGVLGLVGRLLSGLGLGGIVDGLLGGLGLNKILGSLGLGSAYDALVGKKKK